MSAYCFAGPALLAGLWLLGGCASPPAPPPPVLPPPPVAEPPEPPPTLGIVAGRGERLLVYVPREGDTLAGISARFLGSADKAWQISEVNANLEHPVAGRPLVVPLEMPNPLGVTADGVRTVPILCYHRVGPGASKMNVTLARFEAQLDWLAANGWHVVRLSEFAEFMAGRRPLPQRAVVLTFDDGYENFHRHAWPLLRQRGLPATLFVYTDFIGSRDALSWAQMEELVRSGLVDVQAHSKSHRNLVERGADESDAAYRRRLDTELRAPRATIERRLAALDHSVTQMAYPYGDANEAVLEAMQRHGYELGLTVNVGGNPFYASPLLLKRIMIYGDHDLDDFQARLAGRRAAERR